MATARRTPIDDPKAHYADWAFRIDACFYEEMDTTLTERVDRATKHKALRWSIGSPPTYTFQIGDILYSRDDLRAAQVHKVPTPSSVIVQLLRRPTCSVAWVTDSLQELSQTAFADYLRTGSLPLAPDLFSPAV